MHKPLYILDFFVSFALIAGINYLADQFLRLGPAFFWYATGAGIGGFAYAYALVMLRIQADTKEDRELQAEWNT